MRYFLKNGRNIFKNGRVRYRNAYLIIVNKIGSKTRQCTINFPPYTTLQTIFSSLVKKRKQYYSYNILNRLIYNA